MSNQHCQTCIGKAGAPKCHTPLACGVAEDDGWEELSAKELATFIVMESIAILGFVAGVAWLLEYL